MHRSSTFRFFLPLLLINWVTIGHAAPRDSAATAKVDEAINSYYLATEFDRAEAVLIGTLEACEDRCSPPVKARAWMYVGIVRGSGRQDIGGAQQAFQQALALDPKVQLDDALATDAVKEAFAAAAAALGQTPAPSPSRSTPSSPSASVVVSDAEIEGGMECTPQVSEVETRRAIPISCTTDEPAVKVSVRYQAFGSQQWTTVELTKRGKHWQGEIPCVDTTIAGALHYFVRAQDRSGDLVDSYGSKKGPVQISLVNQSSAPPPSLPGQAAPERCMEASSCPEDMIGTPACPGTGAAGKERGGKGWGATCERSWECDTGLLCTKSEAGRSCETAPSCDADSDCPEDSVCISGVCDVEPDESGPSGPFKRHWVGLHAGLDFAFIGGTDVCSLESQTEALFACFYGNDQQYPGQSQAGGAGTINNGFRAGTFRILGSYEFAVTPNIGIGTRLGFAMNGGPAPAGGSAFLPVHLELRGQYWFGQNALGKKGIRPFVNVGGGLAQVDTRLTVRVADCEGATLPAGAPPGADPVLLCRNRLSGATSTPKLDAYKKLGTGFVSLGAGAMYAFEPSHGLVLNVNFLYMFPSSGAVLQPTLGYLIGF